MPDLPGIDDPEELKAIQRAALRASISIRWAIVVFGTGSLLIGALCVFLTVVLGLHIILAVIFATQPLLFIEYMRFRRAQAVLPDILRARHRCPNCGYQLDPKHVIACPECGHDDPEQG